MHEMLIKILFFRIKKLFNKVYFDFFESNNKLIHFQILNTFDFIPISKCIKLNKT